MAVYHTMAVHFPIALWLTAFLAILFRTFSNGPMARAVDSALNPLLFLGVLTGALAYGLGFMVWSLDALISSPTGRNHLLISTWALAYWTLVWIIRWNLGAAIWQGPKRWIMLGLASLGVGLLAISSTLGGNLAGNPSVVSKVLRVLGWDVNTTFYLPDAMLLLVVLSAIGLMVMPFIGRARR